jgi:hypothetical protein
MLDTDIPILTAFTRCICLSRSQLSENMAEKGWFVDSDNLEKALRRLATEGVLIKDMDRAPIAFYRLTFFGTLAVAAAKREKIRKDRSSDRSAMLTAKGTARAAFLDDPGHGKHLPKGRQPTSRAVSTFFGK